MVWLKIGVFLIVKNSMLIKRNALNVLMNIIYKEIYVLKNKK